MFKFSPFAGTLLWLSLCLSSGACPANDRSRDYCDGGRLARSFMFMSRLKRIEESGRLFENLVAITRQSEAFGWDAEQIYTAVRAFLAPSPQQANTAREAVTALFDDGPISLAKLRLVTWGVGCVAVHDMKYNQAEEVLFELEASREDTAELDQKWKERLELFKGLKLETHYRKRLIPTKAFLGELTTRFCDENIPVFFRVFFRSYVTDYRQKKALDPELAHSRSARLLYSVIFDLMKLGPE
jgi:hypothetical protein